MVISVFEEFCAVGKRVTIRYILAELWAPGNGIRHSNGSIRVELLDPFDRVIAGYGAEDCVPVTGDNIEHHITWKSDGAAPVNISGGLEEKMVSQSRGSCKIRLYLDHAKLFAVYTDLI